MFGQQDSLAGTDGFTRTPPHPRPRLQRLRGVIVNNRNFSIEARLAGDSTRSG